jgi:Xaa-Pro aminopeptidase
VFQAAGKTLVPLVADGNLVDKVWDAERPPLPSAPLRVHPAEWCGESISDKLTALRGKLAAAGADAGVVTMLDEVAWLTNCRGSDVSYNPGESNDHLPSAQMYQQLPDCVDGPLLRMLTLQQ